MEMTIHTFELTAILSVEETEKLRNTLFDYAKGKQGMCYKNGTLGKDLAEAQAQKDALAAAIEPILA